MNIDINFRQNQLTPLQNYLKDVDIEVTMILQNLQWDRKHLAKQKTMVTCQYDIHHRVPPDKIVEHENRCFLKSQSYTEGDRLLPSPVDPDATTLVKLSADSIAKIIENASINQPLFNAVWIGSLACDSIEGAGCGSHQPLTIERLQATYTTDERRAIHDAVVNEVPSCHDLSDLALLSSKEDVGQERKAKTRLEILAELRDMRRRRTKYRVAAKTRNYSDVLRDVITTQMDLYSQAHNVESQMNVKSKDYENQSKANNINKVRTTTDYGDNISNRNNTSNIDGRKYISGQDTSDTSRPIKQYEEHETRKRRYDSDRVSNLKSSSSRSDRYQNYTNYDRKSNGRNYRDKTDQTHGSSYKHPDHYESRSEHREREYEREGKTRSAQQSLTTTRDKGRRYDYREFRDKDHSRERHHSRYDRELLVDTKTYFEHWRPLVQTVIVKKEKGDRYDDDDYNSTGSEDSESLYTDITIRKFKAQGSDVTKIKVEKVYLKKEENEYGSKSSSSSKERHRSKIYGRHSGSPARKDKHYKKNRDRTNYIRIPQQEREDTGIPNIKVEKDTVYTRPQTTNDGQQPGVANIYHDRYSNKICSESSRDRYRRDK